MTDIHILVLAAGRGSRMKSNKPKVLHQVAGRSMLAHVLLAGRSLDPTRVQAIIGFGSDQIETEFGDSVDYLYQREQLGTGHAVQCAAQDIDDQSIVLVLYGDVPLVQPQTLKDVVEKASSKGLALLTIEVEDPSGYGRILRNEFGTVRGIVEQKDATLGQLEISEINTGILAARGELLKSWLSQLSNQNNAGEYYLTDIVSIAVEQGIAVDAAQPSFDWEVTGANSRAQLADLERRYQQVQADRLLEQGVTLVDPERFDLRGSLKAGKDVFIDLNTIFEGDVVLGDGVNIGPNCVIKNSTILAGAIIKPFSHIDGAVVGEDSEVGPYARLREGTDLGRATKIGNFVEVKKTRMGDGAKASHLTYLGDADVGAGTNIGAGTITCNYDGKNKHKTSIGENVFVGSNTAIVAPVTISNDSTVAAGSVITKNVGEKDLAVARARQRNIEDWEK